MVTQVVIGQEGQSSLDSSDLISKRGDMGMMGIEVTHSGSKSMRYDPNSGQLTSSGVSSYVPEETQFISAQGNYTSQFDINGQVVLPNGMQTSAKVAMKMGLVDSNGNIPSSSSPVGTQQADQGAQQESEAPAGDVHEAFAMTGSENSTIDDAIPESLSGSQVTAIANQGIDGAVTGDYSKVINSLVQSSGIAPAEAEQRVQQAYDAYSKAGERYLTDVVGMDSADVPEFYSWAQKNAPQQLKGAINQMVNQNKFVELGKLTGKWADANPYSAQDLSDAGYKVTRGISGEEVVDIPGFGQIAVKNTGRYR
jgi:hypothetical protein